MCTAGQRVSLTITGPGPSFFLYKNLCRAADPKGTMSYRTESVRGGQGLSKGIWGLGGGCGWRPGTRGLGLGAVSKSLEGWGLEGGWGLDWAGVLGEGLEPGGTGRMFARSFVRSLVHSLARTDGNYPPLYRTSSPSGPLPKSSLIETAAFLMRLA